MGQWEKECDLFEIKMMNSSHYHPFEGRTRGKHFHFGSFFVYKKGRLGRPEAPTSPHSVLQLL